MGFFDLFSNKPTPAKIAKLKKKMLNEHQQQPIRQESIDELAAFGTDDALRALVTRLGVNFKDTIKNEQEKKYVADLLVEHFGPKAVPAMTQYIRDEQSISAVIIALGRLLPEQGMRELILDTLSKYAPSDHRSINARLQLVDALMDHEGETVVEGVILTIDHDDDVHRVMDLLDGRFSKEGPHYEAVVNALVEVLQDPLASGRITRKAASLLQLVDANLTKHRDALEDFVPDGYTLGTNGRMTAQ